MARRKAEGGEANRVLQPEPHTFPDHRGGVEGVRAARTAPGGGEARGSVDSALNGWDGGASSPGGRLSLDVNVRAPRGTTVDAGVTGGDFIPADRGISVNREMTQE